MRQEPEHFGERELQLLYIAKKLKDALRLEEHLHQAAIDYVLEVDRYHGGVIFRTERVGVFFYVPVESLEGADEVLRRLGWVRTSD